MENLELLKIRAFYANNDRQHDRMILDKLKAFHRALLYSYQGAWIKKDAENAEWCRALINPDKVKFDYDEKIVSVDNKNGFAPGDTFEWPKGSDIHWIILKQELTELAYFRGSIRRCQIIEAIDPGTGEKIQIYCAVRGPVETKINTIQKHGIVADVPNLTLDIYMPNTDFNRALFNRYYRFSFGDRVWKVQAPDSISTPGILEITAEEDYDCGTDDFVMKIDPNPQPEYPDDLQIIGETFIKPKQTMVYTANIELPETEWIITLDSDNKNIKDVLKWEANGNSITVCWTAMVSGSFVLKYGDIEKTIVVESLF